jgi:sucrose phosphorylase
MNNKIMLITYADSLGGNLRELKALLDRYFPEEIGAVHLLPFFPSSGDRGFSPVTYEEVDPAFGTWDDVRALGENRELMFDFMVNHLSRRSPQFLDFIGRHEQSPYRDMFLRFAKFWPGGEPTAEDVALLNKRKNHAPCERIRFADGSEEDIWCTFSPEQMDLNLESPVTWEFITKTLNSLAEHGASMIRLDALAFATKKYGTPCFFLEPELWELAERLRAASGREIPFLPEVHADYGTQLKIAAHGFPVYDFALPVLVLHTLYAANSRRLKQWLRICPRNQYTTLDTHDGIGTVDVSGLMTEEELQEVIRQTESFGANFKMDYSAHADRKPVVYQINCTYYSALGENDAAYLLARAIQFFAPGVPQVYYVGLLAGANDTALMRRTGSPRDISRHNYTPEEAAREAERPVVRELRRLMRIRSSCPAFGGGLRIAELPDDRLELTRECGGCRATLSADLKTKRFTIDCTDPAFRYRSRE